jgi:hypothetical protein
MKKILLLSLLLGTLPLMTGCETFDDDDKDVDIEIEHEGAADRDIDID